MPTMMVLGDYLFSINTLVFQKWARSTEWRWPAQERMGQYDALQFTGPGPDTLELPGVLYPNWNGDINSMDDLRAMGDDGQPYLLVDSMGYVQGRWILERLDEEQSLHMVDGTPQKIDFTLHLRKFDDGEEPDDGASILDKATGAVAAATGAGSGAVSGVTGMISKIQSGAASVLGDLKSAAAKVQAAVAPVLADAQSVIGAVNRGIAVVNDVRNVASQVEQQVKSIGNIGAALSGSQTLLDKVHALGLHAASASAVVSNISAMAGTLPDAATSAMSAASNATKGVSDLLTSAQSAAQSIITKYSA
ncbi:TPA: phage tail protein [Burkholderia vietnamiensis]|nr:phage tail protein [Burkholderia vietnamiensis]